MSATGHVIGHASQREVLGAVKAPAAVLLRGPSGVGKWACAEGYAGDRVVSRLRGHVTMDEVREAARVFRQKPLFGGAAVALWDLDSLTEQAQNVLLKPVEELPEWAVAILVASRRVLPTIFSRCRVVIQFGPLSEGEVVEVLERHGVTLAEREMAAKLAGGSVEQALLAVGAVAKKPVVLQYLDAVARHDRVALFTMLPRWDDAATLLLRRWLAEVLTDWPRVFTKEELGLVHRIGVARFYGLQREIAAGASPELAAMQAWRG